MVHGIAGVGQLTWPIRAVASVEGSNVYRVSFSSHTYALSLASTQGGPPVDAPPAPAAPAPDEDDDARSAGAPAPPSPAPAKRSERAPHPAAARAAARTPTISAAPRTRRAYPSGKAGAYSDDDGATWTAATPAAPLPIDTHGNGTFVSVGSDADGEDGLVGSQMRSPDGPIDVATSPTAIVSGTAACCAARRTA